MRERLMAAKGKLSEEQGQGLVEYALIIAGVALVALAAVQLLGGSINNTFKSISNSL